MHRALDGSALLALSERATVARKLMPGVLIEEHIACELKRAGYR